MYGCIWVYVYESIWWYMNVNGSKWMYMKVYEAIYGICAYEGVRVYMSP